MAPKVSVLEGKRLQVGGTEPMFIKAMGLSKPPELLRL
jgi:hypothetical protein